MKLSTAPPTENYPSIRVVSESGRWECGFAPMLYGVRVRISLAGEDYYTLDYCAGADRAFQFELLATVVTILDHLPESITEAELRRLMPGYKVRPINLDPCWPALQALADKLIAEGYASISTRK